MKRDGENFSEVVKRLADERSWSEVAGILDADEADALEAAIEAGRARSQHRSDRLEDAFEESDGDEGTE